MLKITDLTFHANTECDDLHQLVQSQWASLGYAPWLAKYADTEVIKHTAREDHIIREGISFRSFRGRNGFFSLPLKTFRYMRFAKPDIVLVQGFIYPLQVLILKWFLPSGTVIIAQHHGEKPFLSPVKKQLQKLADRYISCYLFTSRDNAEAWIKDGVIRTEQKVVELQAGSTDFKRLDRERSRVRLGIGEGIVFFWAGRLNANKDPLTVLSAFKKYLLQRNGARLFMAYSSGELLDRIQAITGNDPWLQKAVVLLGNVPHEDLQVWYSAADFFVSGSHNESCGFSLLEAMACGCIPVVTAIPSFQKITQDGEYGILYPAGNSEALYRHLLSLPGPYTEAFSQKVVRYFETTLSFKRIAENLHGLFARLNVKQTQHITDGITDGTSDDSVVLY